MLYMRSYKLLIARELAENFEITLYFVYRIKYCLNVTLISMVFPFEYN